MSGWPPTHKSRFLTAFGMTILLDNKSFVGTGPNSATLRLYFDVKEGTMKMINISGDPNVPAVFLPSVSRS
jgi:hypothetical protein